MKSLPVCRPEPRPPILPARRQLLVLSVLGGLPLREAVGADASTPLLAATQLLVGVERVAKLSLERRLLPTRAEQEIRKEGQRVEHAARRLLDSRKALQGLSSRRLEQLASTADAAAQFAAEPPEPAQQLLGESESLAARIGFLTTSLSGIAERPDLASRLDLFARAGASALRVGKFNLAAALSSTKPAQAAAPLGLRVSAAQARQECLAALHAVGEQTLLAAQQREMQLIRHQWLLFSAALGSDGLAKDPQRLGEVASTTDRIAQSLLEMARRAG